MRTYFTLRVTPSTCSSGRRGGGSLGFLPAILRGLDLDAVSAEPRLLLLRGVQLLVFGGWGFISGHLGSLELVRKARSGANDV